MYPSKIGLSGNALKLLAMVLMTVDHIGMLMFPASDWFRIVGRAAFPIFAYMIAEGARYTRHRPRYLLTLLAVALPCQIAYAVAERSAYQCVLVTFACSVALIMVADRMIAHHSLANCFFFSAALVAIWLVCAFGKQWGKSIHFDIDYGFVGICLPVLIYFGRTPFERWMLTAMGLVWLSLSFGTVQWWCLTALLPLAFYNGQRGRLRMKYLFYIYYPLHLAVLYAVAMWL